MPTRALLPPLCLAISIAVLATSGPGEAGALSALREITIAIGTPNPCWSVRILEVRREVRNGDASLIVVSELIPPAPDMMCASQLATARDRAEIEAHANAGTRHLVLGKTFGYMPETSPPVAFISRGDLPQQIRGSTRIWSRP